MQSLEGNPSPKPVVSHALGEEDVRHPSLSNLMEKPEFTLEAESFRQKSDLPMNADGTQLAVGSSVSPFGE
jgi:hypothetical protein